MLGLWWCLICSISFCISGKEPLQPTVEHSNTFPEQRTESFTASPAHLQYKSQLNTICGFLHLCTINICTVLFHAFKSWMCLFKRCISFSWILKALCFLVSSNTVFVLGENLFTSSQVAQDLTRKRLSWDLMVFNVTFQGANVCVHPLTAV